MTAPTPAEVHTEALTWLHDVRKMSVLASAETVGHFIDHAIRTLERHHPVSSTHWPPLPPFCGSHGNRPEWPCPDAQSALDATKAAGK